jgi:hypothetical protein
MLWGFAGVAAEISQLRKVLKAGIKIRQETGGKIRQEAGINIRSEVGPRPQARPLKLSALDRAQRDELMDRIDQIGREHHLPKRIAAFKAIREHPEIFAPRSSSDKPPHPLNGNPVKQAGNGIGCGSLQKKPSLLATAMMGGSNPHLARGEGGPP